MHTYRILCVIEANTVSGPAKNLLEFCAFLQSHSSIRCAATLVTFVRKATCVGLSTDFIAAARSQGTPIEVIEERHRFDWDALRQFRAITEKHSPHIVQTHGIKSHFFACMTKRRDMHWIAYHHGYTDEDLKMRLYNQLNRVLVPRADLVITVCTPFADALVRRGVSRSRITVLANSITSRRPEVPKNQSSELANLDLYPDNPIVLTVGRLSREKGHQDLLEAVYILRQQPSMSKLRVLIVGNGPERQRLEMQSSAWGLTDCVRFLGHWSNPQNFYHAANLFVLPSRSEGSPNVLLEAMQAGCPIVACDVGGVPETVKHLESALLVPSRDPVALAKAIEQLLHNTDLGRRLAHNAADAVRHNHLPERRYGSLLRLYSALVKRSDSPGPDLLH